MQLQHQLESQTRNTVILSVFENGFRQQKMLLSVDNSNGIHKKVSKYNILTNGQYTNIKSRQNNIVNKKLKQQQMLATCENGSHK